MPITTDEVFKKYTDEKTFSKIVNYASVSEMWEHSLKEYSDLNAICYDGVHYTYKKVEEDAASLRAVLKNSGAENGERIGLLCTNSYDFVKAFVAITTGGYSAAILPPHLDQNVIFGCSMLLGLKRIVAEPVLAEKTELAKSKGKAVISTQDTSSESLPPVQAKGDSECVLMFTGGTTGKSKAAILTNQAVMQGTVNGCYGYKDVFNQKYILALPLSHVFGLIRNLTTTLYTGSEILICKNNKDMFKDICMFAPTVFVAVPGLIELGLKLSNQMKTNLFGPAMKYIIAGAATVSPYLVEECKKLGISLLPGYGLTETANLVSGNPDSAENPESVGFFFPNQEYRIENGELWLKGTNLFSGYAAADPQENEIAFQDGWFKTGDLVRVDEKGYLYITGRTKEIIVLPTGENISPAELETKFNELPFIQDSQVFEDVDESGNHYLSLEVLPRPSELAKIADEDKAAFITKELEEVNMALPSFQRVSKIVIRDTDFERTPSMKIKRYKKCN